MDSHKFQYRLTLLAVLYCLSLLLDSQPIADLDCTIPDLPHISGDNEDGFGNG